MPAGRPTKYRKEYADMMIEFFTREPYKILKTQYGDKERSEQIPTYHGFANMIGTHYDTLCEWRDCKDEDGNLKHPEFSDAYKRCKSLQYDILCQNAIRGNYNPAFSIFFAKNNLGMKDVQVVNNKIEYDIDAEVEEASKDFTD